MKERTRHTLITAEILGFFLIVVGLLGIMTNRRVFIIAAAVLFFLIVIVTAIFVVFFMMAVKQEKGNKAGKRH